MNPRQRGILLVLFLLGPLAATRGTPARADGRLRQIEGTLTEVGANSVTVAGRTFLVGRGTRIDIHGHLAALEDLTPFVGGPVRVTFVAARGRSLARFIQVLPPVVLDYVEGWVIECEPLPDGSVHIVVEDKDGFDFDLFLVDDSEIDIFAAGLFFAAGDVDDPNLLCDLVGGAFVEAEFDDATGEIFDINVEVNLDAAFGRVIDVDPAAGVVTVATFRFGVLEFQVLPTTVILDRFRPIGLKDLRVGSRVGVVGFATESDVLFATQIRVLRH